MTKKELLNYLDNEIKNYEETIKSDAFNEEYKKFVRGSIKSLKDVFTTIKLNKWKNKKLNPCTAVF